MPRYCIADEHVDGSYDEDPRPIPPCPEHCRNESACPHCMSYLPEVEEVEDVPACCVCGSTKDLVTFLVWLDGRSDETDTACRGCYVEE